MKINIAQQIGVSEARTHFYQILEKVENGTEFIVTKHGKPVLKIIPLNQKAKITEKDTIVKNTVLR